MRGAGIGAGVGVGVGEVGDATMYVIELRNNRRAATKLFSTSLSMFCLSYHYIEMTQYNSN